MARPSDMDVDPYAGRITWELALRVDLAAPIGGTPAAFAALLRARIAQRAGGIAPLSVTADPPSGVDVVVPDMGIDAGFWVAWAASALATTGRAGIVTSTGSRCRVS